MRKYSLYRPNMMWLTSTITYFLTDVSQGTSPYFSKGWCRRVNAQDNESKGNVRQGKWKDQKEMREKVSKSKSSVEHRCCCCLVLFKLFVVVIWFYFYLIFFLKFSPSSLGCLLCWGLLVFDVSL